VPLARNSKSELVFVVEIKLSSNNILPLLISPAIFKFPVWLVLPVCTNVPVMLVPCKLVVALTVRSFVITTSFTSTLISPVAAKIKLPDVVVIKLSST